MNTASPPTTVLRSVTNHSQKEQHGKNQRRLYQTVPAPANIPDQQTQIRILFIY